MSKYWKTTYKFMTFHEDEPLNRIENRLSEQDWEVVSHSHSPYGMTVMLRGKVLTDIPDHANSEPKSKLANRGGNNR